MIYARKVLILSNPGYIFFYFFQINNFHKLLFNTNLKKTEIPTRKGSSYCDTTGHPGQAGQSDGQARRAMNLAIMETPGPAVSCKHSMSHSMYPV